MKTVHDAGDRMFILGLDLIACRGINNTAANNEDVKPDIQLRHFAIAETINTLLQRHFTELELEALEER